MCNLPFLNVLKMLIRSHDLMGDMEFIHKSQIFRRLYFSDFVTHIWENVVVVQLHSHVRLFTTPWTAAGQASLSFTIFQSLLKLMSIELMMPFNYLILCRPLLLPLSIFPSIRVSSNGSALHIRWPKYWSFSFSISPSNEYSGLVSFRIDWLDLLAVQETLQSLLQQHSSKASVLQHSAFFMVQLSYSYMTTGKAIALTIRTFVDILVWPRSEPPRWHTD